MPILKIARKMVLFAVELPEPFFVPTIIEKSFTTLSMILLVVCVSLRRSNLQVDPEFASRRFAMTMYLWPLIQKVGVSDKRLITGLKITITNGFHHLLMILPDFFQI